MSDLQGYPHLPHSNIGGAGRRHGGRLDAGMGRLKMQDWNMKDKSGTMDICGPENAGQVKRAGSCRTGI